MVRVTLPPSLAETHVLRTRGGVVLLLRRDWEAALPVKRMLGGAPLPAWGSPVAHSLRGRGTVHVLSTPRGEIVAKQLLRGGVVGALLRRWYADLRRPLREAAAAEQLAARGCPTPAVVAARATRSFGPFHQLEVATERVVGAVDLLEALRAGGSLTVLARAAGRTLRRAHDAGLHHRDLQVKNLLVPAGFPGSGGPEDPASLVVLDLDRCRVAEPLDEGQRVASLTRLARSLVKHGVLVDGGEGERSGIRACQVFTNSYMKGAEDEAARLLEIVRRELDRQVRAHRLLWSRNGG
jgi:3-deoxy-D-manno-octulosonic acid kinase